MLNTFGPAWLLYNDKEIAKSEEMTTQPIGTSDFKFLIRVNRNGTFDIQRRDGVTFNVTVETTKKVCQFQARAEDLLIPPWYRLSGDILQQKYSLRPAEFAESNFRVRLVNNDNIFHRIDIRFLQSSWTTVLIHDNQFISACVNGPREVTLLKAACDAVSRMNEPPDQSRRYGLTVAKVPKPIEDDRQSVRSCASVASSSQVDHRQNPNRNEPTTSHSAGAHSMQSEWDAMPPLITSASAEIVRQRYIKELEMALAAVKMPTFEREKESNK